MKVNSVARALGNGVFIALREVGEAARNDKALAMRMSATALSDQILKGVDQSVRDGYQSSVVPVVRGGLLALNAHRCYETFQNPVSTGMDKFMDSARVVSDLVGFVGGIAVLATRHTSIGNAMMGFSYGVDIVSHAYRGISHAGDRIAFWEGALAEDGDPGNPGPNPDPNPDPKVNPTPEVKSEPVQPVPPAPPNPPATLGLLQPDPKAWLTSRF